MSGAHSGRPPPHPSGDPARPFSRDVLAGPTLAAARALLGARLVRDPLASDPAADPHGAGGARGERRVGRIVEVEAYIGLADQASHARMGPTGRNKVMFGPPGIAYVYLVYGMHHCLNVVTEPAPYPAAVLIRAVEPVAGLAAMRASRSAHPGRRAADGQPAARSPGHVPDARLAAGPGLVAAAFDIDRSCTGLDLCDPASPLRLEARPADEPDPPVVTTPRVGITASGEPWVSVPWRFAVPGSPSLSRPAS